MSFLFPSQRDSVYGIICRIDSSEIAITVIEQSTRTVVWYTRESFQLFAFDDRHYYEQLLHHMQLLLSRMMIAVKQAVTHPLGFAEIVVSEPWAHSIHRNITYSRKTSFTVTEKLLNELLDRDKKKIMREYKIADTLPNQLSIFHKDIFIAGHRVPDPVGRSVQMVTIDYLCGYIDPQVVTLVTKIIHEHGKIPLRHCSVVQYHRHVVRYQQLLSRNYSDVLFIHPCGYTTDLFIFQKNSLSQMGTIPSGIAQAKTELAQLMNLYPQELQSLLSLYVRELLSVRMIKKLETHMYRVYRTWEKDFQSFCHHATIFGDSIRALVWVGDESDPLFQFFRYQVSHHQDMIPKIMAAPTIIDTCISETAVSSVWDIPEYVSAEDRIILATYTD